MYSNCDFHSHSYYSDGVLSPSELLDYAKINGVVRLALTDHDTIDGIEEAIDYSNKIGIDLVTGVEVSAIWNNITIHIVGLDFDYNNHKLRQGLKKHQLLRADRAVKMARGLSNAGISNAYEKTLALVKKSMITRTHFAQMLVNEKVCPNIKTVFRRFLTKKLPGAVNNVKWSSLAKVVGLINQAGGVAVIAHPCRYNLTLTKLRKLASDFKVSGGVGIEVITAFNQKKEIETITNIVNDFDLLGSIGSDYHGWNNSFVSAIGNLRSLPNGIKQVLSNRK